MGWTLRLGDGPPPGRGLIGGKAWSIARMAALGLPVPPAFVVTTRACAEFQRAGPFPDGLEAEIAEGVRWLEERTGRRFGAGPRALLVAVRSGAPVSMPGMMDTVLNMGITEATEGALAAETGDARFARDTHRRFWDLWAGTVQRLDGLSFPAGEGPEGWDARLRAAGGTMPGDPVERLHAAVRAVFGSWNSRRARRYRSHHGIPDDLGTAVTVQAMVFGNLSPRSGTGVMFSRNPVTGERAPYGEYLACAQGEDVVSGRFTPRPLGAMRETVPEALDALLAAAGALERDGREVQDIEFTVEDGRLWLLQSRAAKRAPQAAVRFAVDMVREGVIAPEEALDRVSAEQVRALLAPRLAAGQEGVALAQGEAACPGVGQGVVVADSDEAERRAAAGEAVVLARVTTSPEDLHGMIAARAVITEQGGSTCHAAVVGRALGIPCVTGCGAGVVTALAGRAVTVDGGGGRVLDGLLPVEVPDEEGDERLAQLRAWAEAASPIPVRAEADGALDLSAIPGGEDPGQLPRLLAGAEGATGGALWTEAGMAAALGAGLEWVAGRPRLPLLLAAARAGRARGAPDREQTAVSAQP